MPLQAENKVKCARGWLDNTKERMLSERTKQWLKLYIVVSGLLTSSTFMAILSPFASTDLHMTDSTGHIGTPLSHNQQMYDWMRGFCAISFLSSLLCITSAFSLWSLITVYHTEHLKKLVEAKPPTLTASCLVPVALVFQLVTMVALASSFLFAVGTVLIALCLLISKAAAIFALCMCAFISVAMLCIYMLQPFLVYKLHQQSLSQTRQPCSLPNDRL